VVQDAAAAARHVTDRYANNTIEADHGRFKATLRPMRGLGRLTSLRTIAAGHAFMQTCAAATTRSPPIYPSTIEFASRSTNSPRLYDHAELTPRATPARQPDQRNNAGQINRCRAVEAQKQRHSIAGTVRRTVFPA
jgi:hypothetical protein